MMEKNMAIILTVGRYQHLRHEDGFTLTEMLVTLLIMTLASTLLATGIPVAIDTYTKTVTSANAQMALTATITALRGEYGSCRKYTDIGGDIYYLTQEGFWATISNSIDITDISNSLDSATCRGLVKKYYPTNATGDGPMITPTPIVEYPLVPDSVLKGANDYLYVIAGDVTTTTDSTLIAIASIGVSTIHANDSITTYASVENYSVLARFAIE